jgi:outer membrane protein TolC
MNQSIHKIGSIVKSVILLSSLTWIALYGQSVPVFPPEAGTVPIFSQRLMSLGLNRIIDSLQLHQLEIDIQKAEEQAGQTNFFHRLIPNISISASYGIGNLLFVDPSSTATYIMPKDAYRLSLNLSFSELFFSSKHSDAILQLSRLQTEYQHMKYLQEATQIALRLELQDIGEKLKSLEKQLSMIEDLIHFNELRFEQGKIEYDALVRTKIELLSLQTNINNIKHQQAQLLLKLSERQ